MENKEIVASSSETKRLFSLRSSDGEMFEVEEEVIMEFQAVSPMLEECSTAVVPLDAISGKTLAKVLEFCKIKSDDKEMKAWKKDFVNVDQGTLFDLIMAANYLNLKSLLDLTTQTVADMMKGKSPDQIRKIFNIKNDYTPEEEEEVRRENSWAFE